MHRAANLYAKVPEREREPSRRASWQTLDEAVSRADAKQQLQALIAELEKAGYTAAAKRLADDLDALVVHLHYPLRHRRRWRSTNLLERSLGRGQTPHQSNRPIPREDSCHTLVWAVLDLVITNEAYRIRFTELDRQHLSRVR